MLPILLTTPQAPGYGAWCAPCGTPPVRLPGMASAGEPPDRINYALDEALTLLAALEDARDALIESGHLGVVMIVESEVRLLSRKLGFQDPEGGPDGR